MPFDQLMGDDIVVVSNDGKQTGPFRASVQGNKIFVHDKRAVIEEGDRILRALPNGRSEEHVVLQVNFLSARRGHNSLSHYEIMTRKSTSLVPTPATTINIANSQGIQIGSGNVQNVVGSLQQLADAIRSAQAPAEHKRQALAGLKSLLSHPLVNTILGTAGAVLANKL
jgi:hypothetical protein